MTDSYMVNNPASTKYFTASNYSVNTNDDTGKKVEGSSTGCVEYKIPTYA